MDSEHFTYHNYYSNFFKPLLNRLGIDRTPHCCRHTTISMMADAHIDQTIIKKIVETIRHSYPHCWRHKTPIIFRATPQWFISMDNAQHLREKSLEAIKGVQWIPSWGQNRIEAMVATRPDWCISRQRTWGVPICLFVNKETGELHPETDRLIEEIAKRVEKSGIQAWWDLEPSELLGADADRWQKVPDTLDVWFDSGSTSATVVGTRPEFNGNDADMYLEGSDQHRGWFMSSLMLSMAINGKAPYKKVLTHGFTVDAEGRKMSKSIGNTVAPQEVIKQLGADVLRLWVASTDYTGDMTVSKEIFSTRERLLSSSPASI